MPRASLKFEDAAKGALGFQEGNVLIQKSVSAAYQYPPNSKTGVQSDAFCAIVWTGVKCTAEWEPSEEEVEIVHRIGGLDKIRPGKLAAKDFDNMDAEPEDLGNEVGTEGNALFMEEGGKLSKGWGLMDESMRKAGWKAEIAGRGVITDYEGTKAHFKTVAGEKYVAQKGEKKGQEVTPTNLVCDRIHTYGYDQKKPSTSTASKGKGAAASGGNGHAKPGAGGEAGEDALELAKAVFSNLTPKFFEKVAKEKEVQRTDAWKAITTELMRQNGSGVNKGKLGPAGIEKVKGVYNNEETLSVIGGETEAFVLGDGTITFN